MHRIFFIHELLHNIFENIEDNEDQQRKATLAALARTCRIFCEPALDVLWHTQDNLEPILRCFAASVWQSSEANTPQALSVRSYLSSCYPTKTVPLTRWSGNET